MLDNWILNRWRSFKNVVSLTRVDRIPLVRSVANRVAGGAVDLLARFQNVKLDPGHPWGTRLKFLLRWYEPETVAFCRKSIRPGMVVLDIGAHSGYFSALFSGLVGPSGRVLAFEPHPATYDLLCHNLAVWGCRNTTAVQKAISGNSGEGQFFEMTSPGTHSLFNVSEHSWFQMRRELRVECTTVDRALAEFGVTTVDFIKMDIEGAESRALTGMSETIARSRQLMLVLEFNEQTLAAAGKSPEEFIRQVKDLGFNLKVIEHGGILVPFEERLQGKVKEENLNLLCFK